MKTKFASVAGATIMTLAIAGTAAYPASAVSDVPSASITASIANGEFVLSNSDGTPLTITSSTGDVGERFLAGTTSDGEAFTAIERSATPYVRASLPSAEEEAQQQQRDIDESTPGGSPGVVWEQGATVSVPDDSEFEPAFLSVATADEVSLAWQAPDSADWNYEVFRDGKLIGATNEEGFTDLQVDPDKTYAYQVTPSRDQAGFAESRDINEGAVEAVTTSTTVTTASATSEPQGLQSRAVAAAQDGTTAFIHDAFIWDDRAQLDWIQAPACGQWTLASVSFSGDNRGWRTPPENAPWDDPDSRTMMFTNINWDNPAPNDIVNGKTIGATNLYVNGNYQETRTASYSGISFVDQQHSGSYAQVRYQHDVGNPFCSVGSIQYNELVRFYRSGTVQVVGQQRPVPNHEAYARFETDDYYNPTYWVPVYRLDNDGFQCLIGVCGSRTISQSVNG